MTDLKAKRAAFRALHEQDEGLMLSRLVGGRMKATRDQAVLSTSVGKPWG